MTLFLATLLIIGLNMSYLWYIPAIIIYGLSVYIETESLKTLSKNQRIIEEGIKSIKRDNNE